MTVWLMMEKRLKVIEETIINFGRRHDDCERERAAMNLTLKEVISWKETIQESTEVNRRMVEVGEGILIALSWVGIAARWITAVGAAFAAMWVIVKGLVSLGLK